MLVNQSNHLIKVLRYQITNTHYYLSIHRVYKSRMTRNRSSSGNTSSKTTESPCNTFQCRTRRSPGPTKSSSFAWNRIMATRRIRVSTGSGSTGKHPISKNQSHLLSFSPSYYRFYVAGMLRCLEQGAGAGEGADQEQSRSSRWNRKVALMVGRYRIHNTESLKIN